MKNIVGFTWKTAVLAVAGVLAMMIASGIVPQPETLTAGRESSDGLTLVWLLTVRVLMGAAFVYAASVSRWGGWRLMLALFVAYFGISGIMTESETALFIRSFPSIDLADVFQLLMTALVTACIFTPVAVVVAGRAKNDCPEKVSFMIPGFAWKIGILVLLYPVIYLLFGEFVAYRFSAVRAFYQNDPAAAALPVLFVIQIFRGFFWVIIMVPLLSLVRERKHRIAVAAVFYPVFMSSLLLLPNPLMPEPVRMGHLLETATSMTLFGFLTGGVLYGFPLRRSKSAA